MNMSDLLKKKGEKMKTITLEEYEQLKDGSSLEQGFGWKTDKEFENLSDDEVCYVPEICDEDLQDEGSGEVYTKGDFLDLCNGNYKRAKELFESCDWASPSTVKYENDLYDIWSDSEEEGEEELNDED
jgi:hypothetical protein